MTRTDCRWSCMSKMKKTRKPGGGRKKLKPEYDAGKNLKEQMESAVALYDSEMSLQSIADALALNPIKVRKLLITAGVYESEVAEKVKNTFEEYRKTQDYKTAILSTSSTLQLSKASVTSYLPYQKGVYFPSTEKEKISVGAERQRRYRVMKRWRVDPTEENFWGVVLSYAGVKFKTYSGLPFTYEVRKGRSGEYTKELWIDRRERSKSLAWSSIVLALGNIKEEVVERPILAVHPEQRGKGLARNLMEHIVGSERKAGKKALRLDVIENNIAAEGLYQKLGFRYIQTKTLFYEVVGEMTFKMYELVL